MKPEEVITSDDAKTQSATPKLPNLSQDSLSSEEDEQRSRNPFSDPKIAEHYRKIYEDAKYECRHVFDPDLEWTAAEEKKIVRKLDLRVCTWACVMFFALQVDRNNLVQAVSGTLLEDLGLTTNDYNYGPDRWIPAQMVLWSIVAAAQAGLRGKSTFLACRSLLGLLEGGFIPDLVLWLSYFYTSGELPIRLSFFWTSLDVTGIVISLLAFALFHLDGTAGLEGWRWLFLIEGLITLCVGFASWFLMPASAVQTKAWYRPNGWFSDREVGIVVNRVLRDDPSKGDMHNRMAITPKRLWQALLDYDLWLLYIIGLIVYVPVGPPTAYITLILRNLGFSTFNANLLTIPSTAISIFTLIGITWISERIRERSLISAVQNIWVLPCIIALRWWPGAEVNAWGTYALVTVLLSYPYCHAIVVAWVSRNSGSVRTRSVSAACYNMMVQVGNIISANVYRTDDKPLYHRGNDILFALSLTSIALFAVTKVYYILKNRSRARKWDALTEDQKQDYLDNTTDQGNKRLDFRFVH
ncbi:MAG: hypothetical protein M1820_010144 [Bogoriella megaspora]|nr:MAG: hypothetical protein M1820_010144 [Bogoriella megaspora]